MKSACASLLMILIYLARMVRTDLSWALNSLSAHMLLVGLDCKISSFATGFLICFGLITLLCFDKLTPRTSNMFLWMPSVMLTWQVLETPPSQPLATSCSKVKTIGFRLTGLAKQNATATPHSSTEAEVISLSKMLCGTLTPQVGL